MRVFAVIALLVLAGLAAAPAAYAPSRGFKAFGLSPANRDEAATKYWELRAKYSRSIAEHDDIRFRRQRPGDPPPSADLKKMRGIYDALDEIYSSLYGRKPPWPIHSMDAWYNPAHLRTGDLLVVTYEPQSFDRPLGEAVPKGLGTFFYSNINDGTTGELWARRMRLAREPVAYETAAYDHRVEESTYFDEVLFQTERTLEVYVVKGVVSAAVAAKLRDTEVRLDLSRTIQWTFMDPTQQEPLYHFRIQDSSRDARPLGKGWWLFKPTKRKLRLNVEVSNPDFVPEERIKYGENAKLIEIQRLFKDASIEHGVEAGFGMAAEAIRELHALPDGSYPPEVMIYGETTSDLIGMYEEKYKFEILKQTKSGTWVIRIDPAKFYKLYGEKPALPLLRPACIDALSVKTQPLPDNDLVVLREHLELAGVLPEEDVDRRPGPGPVRALSGLPEVVVHDEDPSLFQERPREIEIELHGLGEVLTVDVDHVKRAPLEVT